MGSALRMTRGAAPVRVGRVPGAGPISNFGIRNSALSASGRSAGPSMRNPPSAKPGEGLGRGGFRRRDPLAQAGEIEPRESDVRAAGIIVFQAPGAVARNAGAGDVRLQMRLQGLALGSGRQARVAERLILQLQSMGGDIGAQIEDLETAAAAAGRLDLDAAAGAGLDRSLHAGARLRERRDLLQRHGVGGYLEAQKAGIEAAGGMVIGSLHLSLLGPGGDLRGRHFQRAAGIVHVRGEAVEGLLGEPPAERLDIGLHQGIRQRARHLRRGVQRAGRRRPGPLDGGGKFGQRRVANGSVAEDLAIRRGFPFAQRHGRLKLRAQPAARQRGVIQPGIFRRNGRVARERIEGFPGDREAGGAQTAGYVRIVQRSLHRAIENGGAVLQFHAHRFGGLAHRRQQVVEIARLQVGAHPAAARAADGAGEIGARRGQREGGAAQVQNAAGACRNRRSPGRGRARRRVRAQSPAGRLRANRRLPGSEPCNSRGPEARPSQGSGAGL